MRPTLFLPSPVSPWNVSNWTSASILIPNLSCVEVLKDDNLLSLNTHEAILLVSPNRNIFSPPDFPTIPQFEVVLWYNSNLLSSSSLIVIIGVDASASITIPLLSVLTLESVSPTMSQLAIFPPVNNTFVPIISPLEDNIKLSLDEFIFWVETSNPPIDADTNLAKPCGVILELAFATVDGEPFISAGVVIWY